MAKKVAKVGKLSFTTKVPYTKTEKLSRSGKKAAKVTIFIAAGTLIIAMVPTSIFVIKYIEKKNQYNQENASNTEQTLTITTTIEAADGSEMQITGLTQVDEWINGWIAEVDKCQSKDEAEGVVFAMKGAFINRSHFNGTTVVTTNPVVDSALKDGCTKVESYAQNKEYGKGDNDGDKQGGENQGGDNPGGNSPTDENLPVSDTHASESGEIVGAVTISDGPYSIEYDENGIPVAAYVNYGDGTKQSIPVEDGRAVAPESDPMGSVVGDEEQISQIVSDINTIIYINNVMSQTQKDGVATEVIPDVPEEEKE